MNKIGYLLICIGAGGLGGLLLAHCSICGSILTFVLITHPGLSMSLLILIGAALILISRKLEPEA
jgi:hypothetical protein